MKLQMMTAFDFNTVLPQCCCDVLDAMYFTTVLDAAPKQAAPFNPGDFAFSLHFSGDISGDFGCSLGESTARLLASNFLGEDEASLSTTEIAEVVGELANMLCGSVMSRIGGEKNYVLSHPEPVSTLPISGDALIENLDTDSGPITAWVVVEGNA